MAINKKLIHFKNKLTFELEVANENILDTSIVFIQDSKEISTHGTIYKTVNWSVLEPLYLSMYTTFEALEDTTFTFLKRGTGGDMLYSSDNGLTWETLTTTPIISAGEKIILKSTIQPLVAEEGMSGIGTFTSSGKFKAYGNSMSLLFGDDFKDKKDLTGKDCAFACLFADMNNSIGANIVDASNFELPATILSEMCYMSMFTLCNNLINTPKLPATNLTIGCYGYMFMNCVSLSSAPELPATNLAASCYEGMFYGCGGLMSTPSLPATTLYQGCYHSMFTMCANITTSPNLTASILSEYCYCYMFLGCTSLNYIKMLANDVSAEGCLECWVAEVSSTGTFVKSTNTNIPTATEDNVYSGIPSGWNIENV